MLTNITFKQKLIFMISIILLLISISSVYIYRSVTQVAQNWESYQTQVAVRQQLLMNIKANFGYGGMIHNFKNYVLRGKAKYLPKIDKNYHALQADLTSYNLLKGLTNEELQALSDIASVAKNYFDNTKYVDSLFAKGKTAEDVDSVVKISDKPALDAFKVLDNQYKKMNSDYGTKINKTIGNATSAVIVGSLIIALVIVAILTFFYTSLIPPLQLLNRTMSEIAQGNGNLSVRLNESRKDELGQVSSSFNLFIEKLERIVSEEKVIIEKIAQSASQLQSITDNSNTAIETQMSHTDQLATAVNEMAATVEDVAKNAISTSDSTIQVNNNASDGQAAVSKTILQIKNINEHLSGASAIIAKVNDSSNEIGQVLTVISAIAEQTNLLALNAAIEAARAGESGRGFAVVADEVRGLAQRTAESLGDIKKIIGQLQSSAKDAVESMEQGIKEVDTGNEIAQEAGESINSIVKGLSTVSDMNLQIATATEEQHATAEEMNKNVHEISTVSTSIYDDSKQIANQSADLAQMSIRLKVLVDNFKTSAT
jgi:methyl-accepting chemotaxis protein